MVTKAQGVRLSAFRVGGEVGTGGLQLRCAAFRPSEVDSYTRIIIHGIIIHGVQGRAARSRMLGDKYGS